MKNIKKIGLFLVLFALVFALASCGADISTKMVINENFKGKRMIEVKIDSDDLEEYVTGGADALKSVADANLPEEMTVSMTTDDTGALLTFTVEFEDLDNYRSKVEKLIKKGGDTELVPNVIYENQSTVFKKGVKFEENFTSFDLIRWYFNALQTSGVVTHEDTSEWYEIGDLEFYVNETEYNTNYGDSYSVDDQKLLCLDSIDVETTLNLDGTYQRTFTFTAYESTVEDLKESGCNLSEYMKKIADKNGSFEEVKDGNRTDYIIRVDTKDATDLVKKTDAVLQSKNSFSVDIALTKDSAGVANVTVKEKLDGSYYLDYDYYTPMQSNLILFDNTTLSDEQSNANFYDGILNYRPTIGNEAEFKFDWKIGFASVELEVDIKNTEKGSVTFLFTAEEALKKEIQDAAMNAMEQKAKDLAKTKKKDNVLLITFEGNFVELSKKINSFVAPASKDEEGEYFSIRVKEAGTNSAFTKAYYGEIEFSLDALIGEAAVTFKNSESFLSDVLFDGAKTEEDAVLTTATYDITFTAVKLSVWKIALVVVFGILFLAGIVLLILNRKVLAEWIRSAKEKKAARAQAPVAAATPAVSAAPEAAAPIAPATSEIPTTTESEETEEIL